MPVCKYTCSFHITVFFVVIFDSANDICDLKIIKDVAEAKLVTASGRQYGKKANDAQILTDAQINDRRLGPKARDGSIVSFQNSSSDVSLSNMRTTVSGKEPYVAQGFKPASAASPRKTSVKAASRASNSKKSQNVAVDSRSSPYKKQLNGLVQNRHPNGTSRMKGYDTARINGCSPNDLTACVQTMTVSDEMVNDCCPETNHRHLSRKRTTSGMASVKHVLLNFSINYDIFCIISSV